MSNCFDNYVNYIKMCKIYDTKIKERREKKNDLYQNNKTLRKEILKLEREKAETLFNLQTQCPTTYSFFSTILHHIPLINNSERNFPCK